MSGGTQVGSEARWPENGQWCSDTIARASAKHQSMNIQSAAGLHNTGTGVLFDQVTETSEWHHTATLSKQVTKQSDGGTATRTRSKQRIIHTRPVGEEVQS